MKKLADCCRVGEWGEGTGGGGKVTPEMLLVMLVVVSLPRRHS